MFPRAQKIAENPLFLDECPLKASMIGMDIDGYSIYGDYIDCARQFLGCGMTMGFLFNG